ncbi:Putative AC transposase [Glycine soja]|uniref:Putative AC transposase n=1 Tax=Glycine soja TaxID=3848 RepID=A0A0B2Q1Y0_GLYSO|nr:Putative AC transposase [Glycine soja]
MSLTAHFIDNDWMLQKKVINFCQVKSHIGKNLTRIVESCLSSWGLTRVLSLTINNATSNDKTIEYMQKRLMSWNRLVLNGNYLHTRCCAHIINLIVQEGFKEDITTICRVHAAVKYVKSSPSRLSKFMECVAHVNIEYKGLVRLDVETRWNSTYLMLEAALKHHKEFEEFKLRDKKFMGMAPTYSDWEFVRSILPFLEIFNYATLRIFGSSYVISTMYMFEAFGIGMKIREMSTSWGVHMSVRTMVVRMKEKYDKYWGNPNHINMLLMISLMLHPSYKLKFTNWLIAKSFDGEGGESTCKLRDKVESSLRSLFEEYSSGGDENHMIIKLSFIVAASIAALKILQTKTSSSTKRNGCYIGVRLSRGLLGQSLTTKAGIDKYDTGDGFGHFGLLSPLTYFGNDEALSSSISHDTATPSTKTKSGKPFKTRVQPPLSSLSAPCSLAAGDQLGYCFHPHFCFDQFASDNALWTPSCANGIGFWSPLTSSSGDSAKRSWKSSWLGRWSTVDRF